MVNPNRGFSLIELVVVIAILAVLLGLGMPSLTAYLENAKVRAAAENLLAGLQQARAEAIRLNTPVEFLLTNDPPLPDAGVLASDFPELAEEVIDNLGEVQRTGRMAANAARAQDSSADSPSGNWLIRTLPSAGGCVANAGSDQGRACWFVAGKRGSEGSGVAAASAPPIIIEGPGTVTFHPLGSASGAARFDFSYRGRTCIPAPPLGNPAASIRCLRVVLEAGGRAKLCDPIVANSDTRACS